MLSGNCFAKMDIFFLLVYLLKKKKKSSLFMEEEMKNLFCFLPSDKGLTNLKLFKIKSNLL